MRSAVESRNTDDEHRADPHGERGPRRVAVTTRAARVLAHLSGVVLALAAPARPAGAQPATAAGTAPDVAPVPVRVGPGGFALESADQAFALRLRGYLHSDARFFLDARAEDPPHTFHLRRARPIVEGTVARYTSFRIMLDFGGGTATVQDAYVDVHAHPWLSLRAGKHKAPFGLERLASATSLLFVERALPTALVPNRDVGVALHGSVAGGVLEYAAGVFNGVADGGSADRDTDKGKDVVGRVFAYPLRPLGVAALRDLGVGVAASWGRARGALAAPGLASLRTSGQATFFRYAAGATLDATAIADGDRYRVSPQLQWFAGRFGLLGEYVAATHEVAAGDTSARLTHHAWQVAGVVVLAGEVSAKGVRPAHAAGEGGPGAFELAGRYHELRVDPDAFPAFASPASAARRARGFTAGAGWWASRHLRLMADFDRTTFHGGASGGHRRPESAVLLRTQIAW